MSDSIVSDRARGVVMALGALSLVASVVAMVYGRKLSPREISPHDSYGRGPLGTRVLVEALPHHGIGAARETDLVRVQTARAPVLFLAPDSSVVSIAGHEHSLASVLMRRSANGLISVVVLPKWDLSGMGVAAPVSAAELNALVVATGMALEVEHAGDPEDRPTERAMSSFGLRGEKVVLPYAQTVNGGSRILASIAEGALVVVDASETVYLVSDSDLVANYDIHRADHAELVVSLLRSLGARSVVVDEVFHGRTQTKSLAEALGEWPGVLVLVQGSLLAVAALLAGRKRFGKPLAPQDAYGRGPREAIEVAADVLTLGRVPTRLASRYVELMIRDLHRRAALREDGHSIDTLEAARALDRLGSQRGRAKAAERLLLDGRALSSGSSRKQAFHAALALAERAHRLRSEWLDPVRAQGDSK